MWTGIACKGNWLRRREYWYSVEMLCS
jgi:hypothetical protein